MLVLPSLMSVLGCDFELVNRPPVEDGVGPVDANHVLVRFYNLSMVDAVDVQFHAAEGPLGDVDNELFVEANRVTGQVGVAGTGLLEPGDRDVVNVPCAVGLIIGTQGGAFIGNETGAPQGMGQLRWAAEGAQFSCGAVITFYFTSTSDGYETQMHID